MTAARWACVVAALGAAAYLLLDPATADHAAQEYRAGLVRDAGLGVWNNGWYAGHHTPAYSLLSPGLGALLGVRLAGALAAVAAAGLFGLIAERHWGSRAGTVAAAWFAVGAVATLVSGRLTFLLGVAIALGALLALQRARTVAAALLAVVATVTSPVAGLFLAIAAVAWGLTRSDRRVRGAAVAVAAVAPALALTILFPEGGTEPFVSSAFWPAIAALALVAVALPERERALRFGTALYALATVAAFAIATPLGGNVTRLGALLAGPVVAGAVLAARGRDGRTILVALALPLAYWQVQAAIHDVRRAHGDPSTTAAYYAPLLDFLDSRPGTFRVEIPFTANHWEAAHVAPRIPLARGWERQLDRREAKLFYDGTLTPATYRAWLDERAVAYVALPDAKLDYSAKDEARLVASSNPSYLRRVWRDAHWQVFAVGDPVPLVSGAADTIDLAPDGFTIRARERGDALVNVHHTRWWAVTGGKACVERGDDGMTRVRVLRPGAVTVQARLGGSACRR